MKDAVLAAEDARFYEHGGVDYKGVVRAALENLRDARSQGASTITMQVARNFYLSTEKTFTRKIYEILLALKIEQLLSKDQILELYMNQIFLGQRAYGFAAAARDLLRQAAGGRDAWPRRRCWPACRRRRRPTTRSPTRRRATVRQRYVHRAHARQRLHHRGAARRGARSRCCSYRAPRASAGARRVRGRDGAPAGLRAVRRRDLHARPERAR